MTDFKHLSQAELLTYRDESIEFAVRREIGRHLLKCPECRERLPLPTVQQFWSAIMNDEPPEEIAGSENRKSSVFSGFLPIWNSHGNLALGGGALALLLGFAFLIWQNVGGGAPPDVAQIQEKDDDFKTDTKFSLPVKSMVDRDRDFESNTNSVVFVPTPRVVKTELPASKTEIKASKDQNSEQKSLQRQERISSTRGAAVDCREETNVGLEYSAEKEDLVFKWKKVPKAAKYHLYISDDDEILIDEFETEGETSFVLRKSLDPSKTYKWRIVVTLQGGETLVESARIFTVKNFNRTRKMKEDNGISEIRCSNTVGEKN